MFTEQNHLTFEDTVNLGSYYTKPSLVNIVYSLIQKNIENLKDFLILDTSCGYGSFLQHPIINKNQKIGVDIDNIAIQEAKKLNSNNILYFCCNSLKNISRKQYDLNPTKKIIVVGNPPYNDTTSIVRNGIKQEKNSIDSDIKTRDLGISFMLSYDKFNADYVCLLHPLSYLIKKSNFSLLGKFKQNYKLVDSLVISSSEFSKTSKGTAFPIIIALYKKNSIGMTYNFIENYQFKTKEGKTFKLNDFISISNYVSKYPNKNSVLPEQSITNFWTMRDINALKRSRTFVNNVSPNTIFVTKNKLDYYCYVDIFKKNISHIPYYLGNCDVMINNETFEPIKDIFLLESSKTFSFLKPFCLKTAFSDNSEVINNYFQQLLGEHYVD